MRLPAGRLRRGTVEISPVFRRLAAGVGGHLFGTCVRVCVCVIMCVCVRVFCVCTACAANAREQICLELGPLGVRTHVKILQLRINARGLVSCGAVFSGAQQTDIG